MALPMALAEPRTGHGTWQTKRWRMSPAVSTSAGTARTSHAAKQGTSVANIGTQSASETDGGQRAGWTTSTRTGMMSSSSQPHSLALMVAHTRADTRTRCPARRHKPSKRCRASTRFRGPSEQQLSGVVCSPLWGFR